jgi:hypothetical protein
MSGSVVRFKFTKTSHGHFVSLAPPRPIPKPQRMRMSRTPRPRRIDKLIMHVLLRIIDDRLNVAPDVIDELPESDRVVQDQVVVTSTNCCVEIMTESPNDLFLVKISNGHLQRTLANVPTEPHAARRHGRCGSRAHRLHFEFRNSMSL